MSGAAEFRTISSMPNPDHFATIAPTDTVEVASRS